MVLIENWGRGGVVTIALKGKGSMGNGGEGDVRVIRRKRRRG